MKKMISLALSMVLLLTLLLQVQPIAAEEITDFLDYETQNRELETFNILYSQTDVDLNALSNCIDPLLTNDNYGQLQPCIAKEWGTEDSGKTWTFHLRDDYNWVDINGDIQAPCVAEDWLWALEWILNWYKNEATNTSMPIQMIAGAEDYYNYTKSLDEEEALALGLDKFKEMVGVVAVDDYTLQYNLIDEFPYFDTLATYSCLYPLSGKLLEQIGVDGYKAVDNKTLWYNGPYIMSTFVHQNEKVYTKNPEYPKDDLKRFDSVTVKMVESLDVAFQLYQTGELDRVELTESNLQSIYRNENNEFHDYLIETRPNKYSIQIHLCYAKNNEDGEPDENWNKAIRNENFRQSWYYGLDFTNYLSRINAINPLHVANYAYCAPNLVAVEGQDYRDRMLEELGIDPNAETYARYDKAKADEFKAKAIEELTAEGVTFPIEVDYWVKSGNQSQIDTGTVLQQIFADCLGSNYVHLNIKEYVSSIAKEVRTPQLGSFYISGWGADFGDPINFLSQEIWGNDNAFFAQDMSQINKVPEDEPVVKDFKEFTELVKKAEAINDDKDARYLAFIDAEKVLLTKALVIPLYYNSHWELTTVNQYSKIYVPYGNQSSRYVNWETEKQGYSTADSIAQMEAHMNDKK